MLLLYKLLFERDIITDCDIVYIVGFVGGCAIMIITIRIFYY